MTTKRRSLNIQKDSLFGGSGIGQQLDDDAAHAGEGTIMSIPLDAIELDEKNARTEGKLTIEQIIAHRSGATDLATLTDKSQLAFFEDLVQLSNALTHHGQFDPILVYEVRQHFGDAPRYKNLGGERRILASYLAGKKTIRATVRPRPENPLVERALALMHNTQRRELSTREKILGIKDVIDLYESIHGRFPNGKELQDVIHEDYRPCARYLRYVTGPSAVLSAIRAGRINSVRAIEYVMSGQNDQDIEKRISEFNLSGEQKEIVGAAADRVGEIAAKKDSARTSGLQTKLARKKSSGSIDLGRVENLAVVKQIIQRSVVPGTFKQRFGMVNWQSVSDVQSAWKQFLAAMTANELTDVEH